MRVSALRCLRRVSQVLRLVDEVLSLSLLEAADLCDLCQEKLAERGGGESTDRKALFCVHCSAEALTELREALTELAECRAFLRGGSCGGSLSLSASLGDVQRRPSDSIYRVRTILVQRKASTLQTSVKGGWLPRVFAVAAVMKHVLQRNGAADCRFALSTGGGRRCSSERFTECARLGETGTKGRGRFVCWRA